MEKKKWCVGTKKEKLKSITLKGLSLVLNKDREPKYWKLEDRRIVIAASSCCNAPIELATVIAIVNGKKVGTHGHPNRCMKCGKICSKLI